VEEKEEVADEAVVVAFAKEVTIVEVSFATRRAKIRC